MGAFIASWPLHRELMSPSQTWGTRRLRYEHIKCEVREIYRPQFDEQTESFALDHDSNLGIQICCIALTDKWSWRQENE